MNTSKNNCRILVSGAGIAGLTVAYWLHIYGFQVDLIEKVPDYQNRKGYMIDFWGPGFDVAEKMNLINQLKKHDHILEQFIFFTDHQNPSHFSIPQVRTLLNHRILTILRGHLEDALIEAVHPLVTVSHSTFISNLNNTDDGVTVTFNNHQTKKYDVLICADGVHSKTRRMIFPDDQNFYYDLGYELAAFIQKNPDELKNNVYTYATPQKQVTVCPTKDNLAASYFSYRTEKHQSTMQSLQAQFQNDGWLTSTLISDAHHAQSALFDRLLQIKMPKWHQKRVVFIGDACQCMTLMAGQGASMAMAGAYLLAKKLNEYYPKHTDAFLEYQAELQPNIEKKQLLAERFLHEYVPNNDADLLRRSYFTRRFFKEMYQLKMTIS